MQNNLSEAIVLPDFFFIILIFDSIRRCSFSIDVNLGLLREIFRLMNFVHVRQMSMSFGQGYVHNHISYFSFYYFKPGVKAKTPRLVFSQSGE